MRWLEVVTICGSGTSSRYGSPTLVQVNHLGGALGRPAPNAVPYREGRFLVRLLAVGGREQGRAVLDPAFALPADDTLGRSPNFAFGAGDRGAGLYDPEDAKEARRAQGTVRPGEPLPQELRPQRLLTNFQAVGSTPIARAAFTASPTRNGVRPREIAWEADMSAARAR